MVQGRRHSLEWVRAPLCPRKEGGRNCARTARGDLCHVVGSVVHHIEDVEAWFQRSEKYWQECCRQINGQVSCRPAAASVTADGTDALVHVLPSV
jgi:hypothetical protein